MSIEAAMLHVVNGFNENANRPNRYASLEDIPYDDDGLVKPF